MTVTLQLESSPDFSELFDEIKVKAQDYMAIAFSDVVLQNFGENGINRPNDWRILGEQYALDYHDGDRTPTLVLSGDAMRSINVRLGDYESSECFSDNEYLAEHQTGNPERGLPKRPVFPMYDNGEITPYTTEQCLNAAQNALNEVLERN